MVSLNRSDKYVQLQDTITHKPYSIPIAPLTTRVYAFAKMTKFRKRYVSHSPIFTNLALTLKETSSGAANELTK